MDKIDQLIKEIAEVESMLEKSKKKGLWYNIRKRREQGKRPHRPGEKGYPKTLDIDEADGVEEVAVDEAEELNEKRKRKKRRSKVFKPQNITDLLATRIKDSLEWRNDITNAMAKSDGRVPDAAKKLGVSSRTLYRNLEEPDLDDVTRAPMGRPSED
jgi:DNA-binding NtrC family response regulator